MAAMPDVAVMHGPANTGYVAKANPGRHRSWFHRSFSASSCRLRSPSNQRRWLDKGTNLTCCHTVGRPRQDCCGRVPNSRRQIAKRPTGEAHPANARGLRSWIGRRRPLAAQSAIASVEISTKTRRSFTGDLVRLARSGTAREVRRKTNERK